MRRRLKQVIKYKRRILCLAGNIVFNLNAYSTFLQKYIQCYNKLTE